MDQTRRKLMIAAAVAAFGKAAGALGEEPGKMLFRTAAPETILAAAKALIVSDYIGTFITVDASGQPRARSILVSKPDEEMMLWMGTRKGSRKLEQIVANPRSTLHFAEDAKTSYASLMGEAHAVYDAEVVARKNPYSGKMLESFFPKFPNDFVLIGFKPSYLEIMTDKLAGKPETWQPQGLQI